MQAISESMCQTRCDSHHQHQAFESTTSVPQSTTFVPQKNTQAFQYEDEWAPPPPPQVSQPDLQRMLGFPVTHFHLYVRAFTHKSRATDQFPSNERLEFIGDAVINLVTARWLFDAFPQHQEGFLTRLRTKLVSGKTLAKLAQHLRLDRFVQMNQRAMCSGWHQNPRILEDCFEALMGAIYLSEGLVAARTFLIHMYTTCVDLNDLIYTQDNWKDQLMRYCQQMRHELPEYDVETVRHQEGVKPTFVVTVTVFGKTGRGSGHTKKVAQQEAARAALRLLGVPENF